MFLSIKLGRWGLFVSSNNDSKCRNMVDGCHLSLVNQEEGGHLTLDSRRKHQGERAGSFVFRNTDFMVKKLGNTRAEVLKKIN